MPSRWASISSAFSGNSLLITCAMRSSLPCGSSPAAGSSSTVRSVPASVKRTAGKAMAVRFTTSLAAELSARSPFMNFSRAGVAKNRSRTSTVVPRLAAAGLVAKTRPPSTAISAALSPLPVRERKVSRATEPIDGSASPRQPSERMALMSSDPVNGMSTATSSNSQCA